uniref:Methionine aminopeptidase n=1 Tax=candidate division CPR3 bacterium TaxID=2268181 RepID=A0A7C4M148_UNCC3
MVTIKTEEEIIKLKKGGSILASVLRELENFIQKNYQKDDFVTKDIDKKCEEILKQKGVVSSFKNYSYHGSTPYPTQLCVSVNEEVVHGIPGNKKLNSGDIVSLDLGIVYEKLYTDAAISFVVGLPKKEKDQRLVEVAKRALEKGITQAIAGNTIGDIGSAIENQIKSEGFGVIKDYCGHGVGYGVHEEPSIPNYGSKGGGIVLQEGMVLAIEPMLSMGSPSVFVDSDGWTVKTSDNSPASHWEHTVAVTSKGPMILTE